MDNSTRIRLDDKAEIVKNTQDINAAKDNTDLCAFSENAQNMNHYAVQIDAACGGGWDKAHLLEVGERT